MVTADNQRLYYGGCRERNTLIWHDDDELLEIHRVNIEPNGADLAPIEVLFIEYDTIQEITLYPDKATYNDYIDSLKGEMTENEYKYARTVSKEAYKARYSKTYAGVGLGYGLKVNK